MVLFYLSRVFVNKKEWGGGLTFILAFFFNNDFSTVVIGSLCCSLASYPSYSRKTRFVSLQVKKLSRKSVCNQETIFLTDLCVYGF